MRSFTFFFAVATASLSLAAKPVETRPAVKVETAKTPKPVRTFRDVLAVLPKELEPENARNWSEARKQVANEIFKTKITDVKRPAVMRFRVDGVDNWGGLVVWARLPADEGYEIRVFIGKWKAKDFLPALASLKKGDMIEVSGLCEGVSFDHLWNTPSLTIGLSEASYIKLQSSGKPAPAPARMPVSVVSAVYGSGDKFVDVTDRVKSLLNEPGAVFTAQPHWLGADPQPGWNKTLVIVHQTAGKREVFTVGEGGQVSAELITKRTAVP